MTRPEVQRMRELCHEVTNRLARMHMWADEIENDGEARRTLADLAAARSAIHALDERMAAVLRSEKVKL